MKIIYLVFLMFAFNLNIHSITCQSEIPLKFDLNSEVSAEKKSETSNQNPYKINFKNEVSYVTGIGGLFTSGFVFLAYNKKDPFSLSELALLNRNEVNGFDRGATFNNSKRARSTSDLLFYTSFALPYLTMLAKKNTRRDFASLFVMSAEAFFISGGLNMNAKHIFNRNRPYVYNPAFPIDTRTDSSSRLSFFSGHTSNTATASFFIAKVLIDYNPDMKQELKVALWTGATLLPAATGYLRIKSGRHYNTDVIFGFVVGASVGYFIPHLHKNKENTLSLVPTSSQDGIGIALTF